jgi:YebC/PmpR family DNA-binding regulatory protein
MAGHSKWAQIKRKKAVADARKGAVFSKLARSLAVAARGNPDPDTNLRLKAEIERARAVNMPSESIQRAVARTAERDSAALLEVQVEFIGPSHTAIIVSAITDNSNRTIRELKELAAEHGGKMSGQGSVLWMFARVVTPEGIAYEPTVPAPIGDRASVAAFEQLLDSLDEHDDVQNIWTNADY